MPAAPPEVHSPGDDDIFLNASLGVDGEDGLADPLLIDTEDDTPSFEHRLDVIGLKEPALADGGEKGRHDGHPVVADCEFDYTVTIHRCSLFSSVTAFPKESKSRSKTRRNCRDLTARAC
jgi:hypothetical protein